MNADDMEKMAEHAKVMADFCRQCADNDTGLIGAAWGALAEMYLESARYWREQRGKADLR